MAFQRILVAINSLKAKLKKRERMKEEKEGEWKNPAKVQHVELRKNPCSQIDSTRMDTDLHYCSKYGRRSALQFLLFDFSTFLDPSPRPFSYLSCSVRVQLDMITDYLFSIRSLCIDLIHCPIIQKKETSCLPLQYMYVHVGNDKQQIHSAFLVLLPFISPQSILFENMSSIERLHSTPKPVCRFGDRLMG